MLILLTNEYPPARGGVGTYCFEVEQAAQALGLPISVWAPRKAGVKRGDIEWLDCGKRVTFRDIMGMAGELKKRQEALKGKSLLLASYTAHLAGLIVILQGGLKGCRVFSLLHGSELPRFSRNAVWRWAVRKLYARVEAVFVASQFTGSELEQSFLGTLLHTGSKRMILAPCAPGSAAINYPRHNPYPRKPEGFYVLTLARLHPRKGHIQMIQSLALLPPALRQQIVYRVGGTGDPAYLKKIEALCAQHQICLDYLGEVSDQDLPRVYASCDCFAMTSLDLKKSVEGFGISYLEAGWHEKPSIGFRSGGVAEAVIDGQTGFLLEQGDCAGVARALTCWLEDPNLLKLMGESARRHALSFSWGKTAQTIFAILAESI